MKIERDLMTAIRAAAKFQDRPDNSYVARANREKAAVAQLAKRRTTITKDLEAIRNFRTQIEKIEARLEKIGVSGEGRIYDTDDFTKAGGKPPVIQREWTAEEVFRKLAVARDQKTFDAILAEYKITWK